MMIADDSHQDKRDRMLGVCFTFWRHPPDGNERISGFIGPGVALKL